MHPPNWQPASISDRVLGLAPIGRDAFIWCEALASGPGIGLAIIANSIERMSAHVGISPGQGAEPDSGLNCHQATMTQ